MKKKIKVIEIDASYDCFVDEEGFSYGLDWYPNAIVGQELIVTLDVDYIMKVEAAQHRVKNDAPSGTVNGERKKQ